MSQVNPNTIKVGNRYWTAEYDFASGGGVRCTKNLEPVEVEIIKKEGCRIIAKLVKTPSKAMHVSEYRLYLDERGAFEAYRKRLLAHVDSLLSKIKYVSNIGALGKRLKKYELDSTHLDLVEIGERANSIQKRIADAR